MLTGDENEINSKLFEILRNLFEYKANAER